MTIDMDAVNDMYFDKTGKAISLREWARLMEDISYRRIAFNQLSDDSHYISTVWLGMNDLNDPPLIFETMIFPQQHIIRYATEAEALAGHQALITSWKEEEEEEEEGTYRVY